MPEEKVLAKVWRQRRVVSTGRGVLGGRRVRWSVSDVPGMGKLWPSLLEVGQLVLCWCFE